MSLLEIFVAAAYVMVMFFDAMIPVGFVLWLLIWLFDFLPMPGVCQ